jgi:hypothetical protein
MRRASSKLFQEQQRRCGLLDGRPNPESYALDTARRQRDYQEDCTKQAAQDQRQGQGNQPAHWGVRSINRKIGVLQGRLGTLA